MDTERALERVVRESYGRLVAFLAARSRNLAAAEDALSDAFGAALEHWPRTGVPDNPDAWLLTVARRRLIDVARHGSVVAIATSTIAADLEAAQDEANRNMSIPDRRLELLFMCAHPAIHPSARAPLMLQTVLGLDAARIASAFLVQPTAMGQRLSRAKTKIRDAGIPFRVPDDSALPDRLDAVLNAIYGAYASGWDDVAGADPRRRGLADAAIELGRVLARLMPSQPEALGLLALMLHCEARRRARRTPAGEYVPLTQQDATLWSHEMIEDAEACLARAARVKVLGRFQLEAAIQSAHAQRRLTGRTDWDAVAQLYEGLVRIAPTIGARIGCAAAVAEARGAEAAWPLLGAMPAESVAAYQPYWACAAHVLRTIGRHSEARAAADRAIGLTEDASVREFLIRRARRDHE
jgi:RNA polymerase sigma-70 factor (ECF subfamily)